MNSVALLCVLAYVAVASAASWTYENPDRDWPSITPECAGQRQSPINVEDAKTVPTTAFFRQYQSRLASFDLDAVNNGHSVDVGLAPRQLFVASSLFPDLMQAVGVHWHAPSEHRVDGHQFAAEMHIVYQPIDRAFWTDGRPPIAVVGFLLDELDDSAVPEGELAEWQKMHNDTLLNELLSHKEDLEKIGTPVKVKFVPRLPFFSEFYVYEGSLTTPLCNETVQWHLATTPMKVPKKQLEDFLPLLRQEHGGAGDARPIQPLNGRTVRKVQISAAQPVLSNVPTPMEEGEGEGQCKTGGCGGATMNFYFGNELKASNNKKMLN